MRSRYCTPILYKDSPARVYRTARDLHSFLSPLYTSHLTGRHPKQEVIRSSGPPFRRVPVSCKAQRIALHSSHHCPGSCGVINWLWLIVSKCRINWPRCSRGIDDLRPPGWSHSSLQAIIQYSWSPKSSKKVHQNALGKLQLLCAYELLLEFPLSLSL